MTEEKRTRSYKYEQPITEESKIEKKKKVSKDTSKEEKEHKEHPLLKKILLIILSLTIILILYSSFIGNKIIDIKEYKIESTTLPNSFHGLKIVQLSDFHYGTTINKKQLDKIVNQVNELKPDILFFTGDLLDKNITLTEDTKKELIESLSNLKCTLYKYAIYGDEDLDNTSYKEIIESSNFTLLENTSTLLYYKDTTPIEITGYNPIITNPNYTILTNLVDEQDTTNYYKIVLVHEPDSIDKFINYKPNLVLSGHSLGGLIKIPYLKPIFLPENATKYYEDYYKINNTDFYISNGLGTSGINARLNNHPSINLYRLYKAK